jgi:hypothetical protein
MNDNLQRVREPELKEVLISLETLSNRFDGLTIDLKNKIQLIHNPPQLEPVNKTMEGAKSLKPDCMISSLNEQINRLKDYGNRIEDLLMKLNNIKRLLKG